MSAVAQKEKDKGNAAFKSGDFPTAIGHYTAAFLADPSNATYPLNRAAAYLKLGKNDDAERDCDAVLRLDKKNVKGFFRRGQARVALQKLQEAESDYREALRLEPANDSVEHELKKVQDALNAVPSAQKLPVSTSSNHTLLGEPLPLNNGLVLKREPIDVSAAAPSNTASGLDAPPKRRRVPITIVEPEPAPATSANASTNADAGLLTPVSSRTLSRPSSAGSGTAASIPASSTSSSSTSATTSSAPSTVPAPSGASASSKPLPKTFKEAKAAREELRPRGGIFRAEGKPDLFYAPAPSTPSDGDTDTPRHEPPQTLVAFMRIWEPLDNEEERWDVLREIPPARLPVLFKTSLDAALLAAIVRSLRGALTAAPEDEERVRVVRAYMVNLPRVPRFNTVSLMMDKEERAQAQAVWELLGNSGSKGVEGEMDRRKDDGSRRAWGCR